MVSRLVGNDHVFSSVHFILNLAPSLLKKRILRHQTMGKMSVKCSKQFLPSSGVRREEICFFSPLFPQKLLILRLPRGVL